MNSSEKTTLSSFTHRSNTLCDAVSSLRKLIDEPIDEVFLTEQQRTLCDELRLLVERVDNLYKRSIESANTVINLRCEIVKINKNIRDNQSELDRIRQEAASFAGPDKLKWDRLATDRSSILQDPLGAMSFFFKRVVGSPEGYYITLKEQEKLLQSEKDQLCAKKKSDTDKSSSSILSFVLLQRNLQTDFNNAENLLVDFKKDGETETIERRKKAIEKIVEWSEKILEEMRYRVEECNKWESAHFPDQVKKQIKMIKNRLVKRVEES